MTFFFFSRQQILPRFRLASRPPKNCPCWRTEFTELTKQSAEGNTAGMYFTWCLPWWHVHARWVVGIAVDRDVLYLTSPMMTCTPGKWVVGIAIDRDVLTWCSPWWLVQTRWVDCGDSCRQECTLPYVPHDMYMPGEWVVGIAVDRDVLYLLSPMTCACQVSGL